MFLIQTIQTPWRPQLPLPQEVPATLNSKALDMDKQSIRSSSSSFASNQKKKWSLGRLFKTSNKKQNEKIDETNSSSDDDRKAGFFSTYKARLNKKDKRNKQSSKLQGNGFDHIVFNPKDDFFQEPNQNQQPQKINVSSTNSLDRRASRQKKELKKLNLNVIHQNVKNPSSDDDIHSFDSVKHRSDESLYNSNGSNTNNNNYSNRKSRAARTERYYKRISRDNEISSGGIPNFVQQKISKNTGWKIQPDQISIQNGNVDNNQYRYKLKNSTSMTNVPYSYGVLQQKPLEIKSPYIVNDSVNSIGTDQRSLSYDNHIYLVNRTKNIEKIIDDRKSRHGNTPPPPPPRDPMRRVNIASSHNDIRPISYAFDRNSNPTVNSFKGKCVSHDRLYGSSNLNMYDNSSMIRPSSALPQRLSVSPLNPMQQNQKRFIKREQPLNDYRYIAESTPRSRKPIHLANKPDIRNEYSPQPSNNITLSPIRTTKEGILTSSASEFWKKIDKQEISRRGRNTDLNRNDPTYKPRSISSSRVNELNAYSDSDSFYKNFKNIKGNVNLINRAGYDEVDNVVNGTLRLEPATTNEMNYIKITNKPISLNKNDRSKTMPNYITSNMQQNFDCKIKMPLGNKYDQYVAKQRRNLSIFEPAVTETSLPPDPPTRQIPGEGYIKKPTNLEDAINELEEIYKSLRLGDDELLERAERRDIPTPTNFEKYAKQFEDDEDSNSDEKQEPDVINDDVAYRNLKFANTKVKTIDNQPPFGIPIGPVVPSPRLDYLHVTPEKDSKKIRYAAYNHPDLVTDDLAVRSLRKDQPGQVRACQLYPTNSLKKKRATRTQSANIYNLIQRDAAKPSGGNLFDYDDLEKGFEKSGSLVDLSKSDDTPITLNLLKNLKNDEKKSPSSITAKKEMFRHPSQGGAVYNLPLVLKDNERHSETKNPVPLPRKMSLSPEPVRSNSRMEEVLNLIAKEAKESSEKLSRDLIELRKEARLTTVQHEERKKNLIDIENVCEAAKKCEEILSNVVPPIQDNADIVPSLRKLPEKKLLCEIDRVSDEANRTCDKILHGIIKTEPPIVVHEAIKVKNYPKIETSAQNSLNEKIIVADLIQKLDPSSDRIGQIAARCMRQISELGDLNDINYSEGPDYDNLNENLKNILTCKNDNNFENQFSEKNLLITENINNNLLTQKALSSKTQQNAKVEEEEIDRIMKECEEKTSISIFDDSKELKITPILIKCCTARFSEESTTDVITRDGSCSHHSTDGGLDGIEDSVACNSLLIDLNEKLLSSKPEAAITANISCQRPNKLNSPTTNDQYINSPTLSEKNSEKINSNYKSVYEISSKSKLFNNSDKQQFPLIPNRLTTQISEKQQLDLIDLTTEFNSSPLKINNSFDGDNFIGAKQIDDNYLNHCCSSNRRRRRHHHHHRQFNNIIIKNDSHSKSALDSKNFINEINLSSTSVAENNMNNNHDNLINNIKNYDLTEANINENIQQEKLFSHNLNKVRDSNFPLLLSSSSIIIAKNSSNLISTIDNNNLKSSSLPPDLLHNPSLLLISSSSNSSSSSSPSSPLTSKFISKNALLDSEKTFENIINLNNSSNLYTSDNYNNNNSNNSNIFLQKKLFNKNNNSLNNCNNNNSEEYFIIEMNQNNSTNNDSSIKKNCNDNKEKYNQNIGNNDSGSNISSRRYITRSRTPGSDTSSSSNTLLLSRVPIFNVSGTTATTNVKNKVNMSPLKLPLKYAASERSSSSSPSSIPHSLNANGNKSPILLVSSHIELDSPIKINDSVKCGRTNNNESTYLTGINRNNSSPKKLSPSHVRTTKASRLRMAATDKRRDSNEPSLSVSPVGTKDSPKHTPKKYGDLTTLESKQNETNHNKNSKMANAKGNIKQSIKARLKCDEIPSITEKNNVSQSPTLESKIKLVPTISVSLKQTLNEISFNANRNNAFSKNVSSNLATTSQHYDVYSKTTESNRLSSNDDYTTINNDSAIIPNTDSLANLISFEEENRNSNDGNYKNDDDTNKMIINSDQGDIMIKNSGAMNIRNSTNLEDRDKSSKRKSNLNRAYNDESIKNDDAALRRRRRKAGMSRQLIPTDENISSAIRDVLDPIKAQQKLNMPIQEKESCFSMESSCKSELKHLKPSESKRASTASPKIKTLEFNDTKHEPKPFKIDMKFSDSKDGKIIEKMFEVPLLKSSQYESDRKKRFYQRRVDKLAERTKSDLAEIQKITAKCRSLTPGLDLKNDENCQDKTIDKDTEHIDNRRRYFTIDFGDKNFQHQKKQDDSPTSFNKKDRIGFKNSSDDLQSKNLNQIRQFVFKSNSQEKEIMPYDRRKSSDDHSASNPIVSILKKKDDSGSSTSNTSPVTFSSNVVDTPSSSKRQGILKKRSSLDESRYLSRSHSPDDRNSILIKSSRRNSLEEISHHGILKQRSYESDSSCPNTQHGILKKRESPSDSASGSFGKHVSISQAVILAAAELCNDIIIDNGNVNLDSNSEYEQIKPILKTQESQDTYLNQQIQTIAPKPILKKKPSQDTEEIRPILKTSRKSSREESSLEHSCYGDEGLPQRPILKNSNQTSPNKRLSLALENPAKNIFLQRSFSLENPDNTVDIIDLNLTPESTADELSEVTVSVAERIKLFSKDSSSIISTGNQTSIHRPRNLMRTKVSRNRFQSQPVTNFEFLQTQSLDILKSNSLSSINHHINSKFTPVCNRTNSFSNALTSSPQLVEDSIKFPFNTKNNLFCNMSGDDDQSLAISEDKKLLEENKNEKLNDTAKEKINEECDKSSSQMNNLVNESSNETNKKICNDNEEDIGNSLLAPKINLLLTKSKSGCVAFMPADLNLELKNRLKKSSTNNAKVSSILRNSPSSSDSSQSKSPFRLSQNNDAQNNLAKIRRSLSKETSLKHSVQSMKTDHDDTVNLVRNLSTLGSGRPIIEDTSTTSEGESSGGAEISAIIKKSSIRRHKFGDGLPVAKSKSYSSFLDDSKQNSDNKNAHIDTEMGPDQGTISKTGSIAERLQKLQKSEEEWKKRIPKSDEVAEINNSICTDKEISESDVNKFSDRLDKLKTSSENWKTRVEKPDASKFTIAARLLKADVKIQFERLKPCKPKIEKIHCTNKKILELDELTKGSQIDNFKSNSSKNIIYSEVSVPNVDDELFSSFFSTTLKSGSGDNNAQKLSHQLILDVNFDLISSTDRLASKRKIQRPERRAASKNPLKALAEREDLQAKYTEIKEISPRIEQRKQDSFELNANNLAAEAIAGLMSVEDFKSINLKSSVLPISQFCLPYKSTPMLLHIKGRIHVQTRLVESTYESINNGDCYILITKDKLYRYVGSLCNIIESSHGKKICAYILENKDLGCTATSEIVLNFDTPNQFSSHWVDFWKILDKPSDYQIPDSGHADEDEIFELSLIETNKIYEFSDNSLVPLEIYWGAIPKIEMLDAEKILVFDFGSEMYVWSGKNAESNEKRLCLKFAEDLFTNNTVDYSECYLNPINYSKITGDREYNQFEKKLKRPNWCLLGKITQNMETCLFREKFLDWPDCTREDLERNYLLNNVNVTEAIDGYLLFKGEPYTEPNLVLENSNLGRGNFYYDNDTRRHYDILTKSVTKFKINEFNYEIIENDVEHFYSAESYIIKWIYQISISVRELSGKVSNRCTVGRDRAAIFCWQGKNSTKNEKGAAALLAVELDKEKGSQILVPQGDENTVFVRLFKIIFIHSGRSDECLARRSEWRLFILINGIDECEIILKEVNCNYKQLRSHGTFFFINGKNGLIYLWHGSISPSSIREITKNVAEFVKQKKSNCLFKLSANEKEIEVLEIEEGQEPSEIKNLLGLNYVNNNLIDMTEKKFKHTPRLFHFSGTDGGFTAKEILFAFRSSLHSSPFPFTQSQLYNAQQPTTFLIDNCDDILWIWCGWWPNDLDKEEIENSLNDNRSGVYRWTNERKATLQAAVEYWKAKNVENDGDLSNLKGFVVWAGLEPIDFINIFPDWKHNEAAKEMNLKDNRSFQPETISVALAKLTKSKYDLDILKLRPLPEGVDPCKLENYIKESEFFEALGIEKAEFDQMPIWKQTSLKKERGLF